MSQENSLCALPERIDLCRLAEQDAVYETKLNHEIMTRLADACEEIEEPALVKLHFYKDLQGLSTLEGEISCKLKLICERCGKPFSTVINAPFCVTCDKEKALELKIEDRLDIIDLDEDGLFNLYAFIEDSLLLELPTVARHENEEECDVKGSSWTYKDASDEEVLNPFAVLKDLKGKLN